MGRDINGRADQYALAATAYHLLTGTPVYSDSNPVAVISHHLTEPPPAPSTIRPELAPFDLAFARALAKKPEDRFERCQDFARALAAAAEGSELGYPASAPTQQAPIPGGATTTVRAGRSPKAALAAAGALLVLIAGALLWHPWTNTGPTPATLSTSTSSAAPSTSTTTTTTMTTSSSTAPPAPPPALTSTAPPPPTSAAPPPPKYPRAGALGDGCSPPHAIGTAADGSLYYCEALQSTDVFEWAPTPGPIPNPNAPPPYTPPPAWQINPNGPAPLTPCTTPGAVVPGTLGLMQCQPPLFTGGVWMWGVAPR
jgi:serine/threonine-protein kinase